MANVLKFLAIIAVLAVEATVVFSSYGSGSILSFNFFSVDPVLYIKSAFSQ